MLGGERVRTQVKRFVFSMFGGLGGDFCKDTYEAKLFGMHIGSVLSGLDAGNVNTALKYRLLGLGTCLRGSKITTLRCLETLEGTFIRNYEAKLFGMHICVRKQEISIMPQKKADSGL